MTEEMTADGIRELLERFKPLLLYDSQEAFFADSAAEMTENPGNTLRRAPRNGTDGSLIAAANGADPTRRLSLDFLGSPGYGDSEPVRSDDRLSIAGQDYRTQYVRLRQSHPQLRNRIYGRVKRDRENRLWLQYWFWYFCNDYHLAAGFGLHEGDWEMIQLRIDGDTPDVAVYAQHRNAERRPWASVKHPPGRPDTPLVYPGRGSHASYFEPGLYETEAWFDIADGRRGPGMTGLEVIDDGTPSWIAWPGMWGDTEPSIPGIEQPSPHGPCCHQQWKDPEVLLDGAVTRPVPRAINALPAPKVKVSRRDGTIWLGYDSTEYPGTEPVKLVVTVNSKDERDVPPRTFTFGVERTCAGQLDTRVALAPDRSYDIYVSASATSERKGVPSESTLTELRPEPHRVPRSGWTIGVLSWLYAITHTGRRGPVYVIGTLGPLDRTIRLLIAAAAIASAWVVGVGGVANTIVFALPAALALVMFVTAATGFCPTRTFAGWRVRLAAADYTGRVIAWLAAGGRLVLLSLVATVAAVLSLPIQWWEGVLGWSAAALFVAAMRAHVRVIIEDFDDFRAPAAPSTSSDVASGSQPTKAESGKDTSGKQAKDGKNAGTAVLLANRLATMRDLYGFVDDPDRRPTPDRPTSATIQLEDPSSVLRSAVTTESTVSFGGFSIPLGAAMGLLGRLVQAPRLRGAIHGDEQRVVVTAELVMNGQPYAWHVPKDDADPGGENRTLEALINDELAYQVFSDLTLQRQARWPATRYWLRALEKMGECQRRQRNRRLLLNEAESYFRQALAEDERFYLACLNLGIVYRRLAVEGLDRGRDYMLAARRVFELAVRMCPDRWEAYHALADAHWETYRKSSDTNRADSALEMISGLCKRALSRNPDRAARARILDLQGQAETAAARTPDGTGRVQADSFQAAIDTRRSACWLAMSELARTRLRRVIPSQASRLNTLDNLASQCLLNLARTAREAHVAREFHAPLKPALPPDEPGKPTRRDRSIFRAGRRLARLAVYLADVDAVAHQRLAEFAYSNGRLDVAAAELSAAARIAPADPRYGAQLAFVLAKTGALDRARDGCVHVSRLIDFGDPAQKEAQQWLIATYRAMGQGDDAEKLEKRTSLAAELKQLRTDRNYVVGALAKLLRDCGTERDWEAARVRMELGRLILESIQLQPEPGAWAGERERLRQAALALFEDALAWFEKERRADKWLADLHSGIAQALVRHPADRGKALLEAERAMILDPLEPRHRDTLSRIYEVGGDLTSACRAADDAVLLDPDNPDLHHRSAMLRWRLAESLADPVAHKKERQAATTRFEETLNLYGSEQRRERRTTSWWLAMSYFAMSEFERVPAHLQFVLASTPSGSEASDGDRRLRACTKLWLAKTYRKLGKYVEAKKHAREAVEAAVELRTSRLHPSRCLTESVGDGRWPLWTVLALSYLQLAGSHTDRAGNARRAAASLADVREVFDWAEKEGIHCRETDIYAEYLAETGRRLLAKDKSRAAIAALRSSVDIDPDEADIYLLLAHAHARAAEQRIAADWQVHVRGARAACKHTVEIGGTDHPDAMEAAEVEKLLDRLEAQARRGSTVWSADGRPGHGLQLSAANGSRSGASSDPSPR